MAKEEKVLTLEQKEILDLVSKENYLVKRFYLTGGTPLSAFYLFHRISEDLDFFSEKEIHLPSIRGFIGKVQKKLNLVKVVYRRFLGLHSFYLFFTKEKFLKIDFNYYPFDRTDRGLKYTNIIVG